MLLVVSCIAFVFSALELTGDLLLTIVRYREEREDYVTGFSYAALLLWLPPFAVNVMYILNYRSNAADELRQ